MAVVAGAAVAVPGWAPGPVIAWSWGGTVGCCGNDGVGCGTSGGPACGGVGDVGGWGRCGGVGVGFGTLGGDWYWSPWDSTLYKWGLSRWQMHTPCTVTCEVSPVVLFGEMYNPAPSASTLKVSETTVRWAPMLTQARACTQRVVPKECMSPNTRCGPKSPFQHIAQKCACLLGLLFGG